MDIREKVDKFVELSRQLLKENYNTSYYGDTLHIDEGKLFYNIRGTTQPFHNFESTFARIDINTGDIYSHAGKKAVGNIDSKFNGMECIDRYGVIVNKNKLIERYKELQ
jgi:hypothetical protein